MFGPLFPTSTVPVTPSLTFGSVHIGAGANSKHEQGLGVNASIASDATWRLRWNNVPYDLPVGTLKLQIWALANATSGAAKINPKWASVAAEEDPSTATLNAEGTQTITWAAGDNDQYKELEVTLDADTLVGGEALVMDLVMETSGWTLAQIMTMARVALIWE